MANNLSLKEEFISESTKGAPAVAGATGTVILGLPLADWAVIAVFIYTTLQAMYLLWKWRKEHRESKK